MGVTGRTWHGRPKVQPSKPLSTCPVCSRLLRGVLCGINFPLYSEDTPGVPAPVCSRCRDWAKRLFDEFAKRKHKPEQPPPGPARCPECGTLALKGVKEDAYYCSLEDCEWFGTLDASCDCCDAPMEPTGPVDAYGIETYACPTCRNVEY